MTTKSLKSLETVLEKSQTWPGLYTFKFVVPVQKIALVEATLGLGQCDQSTHSRNGRWQSLTFIRNMQSPQDVCEIYSLAAKIDGVISL